MRPRERRPTRRILTAAAVALVLPAIAVTWLGVLLLQSDRELDRQRVQERLASAATLVVASLEGSVSQAERRLAALPAAHGQGLAQAAGDLGLGAGDGTVVVMADGAVWSSAPLVYVDAELPIVDRAGDAFTVAEQLEFVRNDLAGAMAAYGALARSADTATRGGALARIGRVARKLNQPAAALAAYDSLEQLGATFVLGRPADLVAVLERGAVHQQANNVARLQRDAATLERRLAEGHWRLSRSQYMFYMSIAREWIGTAKRLESPAGSASPGELVADGVEALKHAAGATGAAGGRQVYHSAHGRGVMVWQRIDDHVAALVVTEPYLDRTWLAEVRAVAEAQRARVTLTAAAPALAGVADGASQDAAGGGQSAGRGVEWLDGRVSEQAIRRSAAETGLPFTVRVSSADPDGDVSTFAGRRRLLTGLVVALALLVAGSGYLAARGAAREVAAARLQSDFVAAVSHEFRTPVASVRQLSEMLDEGRVPGDSKRQEYYGRIRRQTVRLQHLVENLLDFGRMESSAAEYRLAPTDPAELLRATAEEFDGTVRETGRRVDVRLPAELPSIAADREALGRAVWNLLDNAAKYSPPGAPIVLEAESARAGVVIRVRDQGPGIPASEHDLIFDKFVRGAHARESGAKGTGLGLAMVRHIVRAHRGEVRVESAPGEGATFSITLPVTEERV